MKVDISFVQEYLCFGHIFDDEAIDRISHERQNYLIDFVDPQPMVLFLWVFSQIRVLYECIPNVLQLFQSYFPFFITPKLVIKVYFLIQAYSLGNNFLQLPKCHLFFSSALLQEIFSQWPHPFLDYVLLLIFDYLIDCNLFIFSSLLAKLSILKVTIFGVKDCFVDNVDVENFLTSWPDSGQILFIFRNHIKNVAADSQFYTGYVLGKVLLFYRFFCQKFIELL